MSLVFIFISSLLWLSSFASFNISCPAKKYEYSAELLLYKTMGAQLNQFHGRLVAASPIDGCSSLQNINEVAGNVVFTLSGTCDPPVKAKYVQEAGGAILVIGQTATSSREAAMPWSGPDISIAVYDAMTGKSSTTVQNQLTTCSNMTVIGVADVNSLNNVGAWVFFSVFLGLMAAISLTLAWWKLYKFILAVGPEFSIPQIILVLEIIANIIRILYYIDPAGIDRFIWEPTPRNWFQSINWPISEISQLLVAFYWYELAKSSFSYVVKLNSIKLPMITISVILLALEIAGNIIRELEIGALTTMVIVTAVVDSVASGAVAIFFIYNGSRILNNLRNIKKLSDGSSMQNQATRKISIMVIVSGAGTILFSITILITGGLFATATFVELYVLLFLVFFGLQVGSITQILVIATPTAKATSGRSGASTTGTNLESDADFTSGTELESKA